MMAGAIRMFLHLRRYCGSLFSVERSFGHPSSRHLLLDRVIVLFVALASPSLQVKLRIVVLVRLVWIVTRRLIILSVVGIK